MMHQLHKILYICQLPPTLDPHPKRRLVEKFKRALFAPYSDSLNLKTEVKKVTERLLCGGKALSI
jgi:NIMA (never in mitosis gene a)-related kinase